MDPTAFRNNEGFTLVEVLVAMVILLLGLMASLYGVMTALDYNLSNNLRNEARIIAQEQMENTRNTAYANIPVGDTVSQIQKHLRKAVRTFQVTTSVVLGTNLKQVRVTVQWTHKDRTHSYALESIVGEAI